jgi:hypothetical protein
LLAKLYLIGAVLPAVLRTPLCRVECSYILFCLFRGVAVIFEIFVHIARQVCDFCLLCGVRFRDRARAITGMCFRV